MSTPKMHPVDSSCVARLGYDETAKETYVEFRSSAVYRYLGVPPSVH